MRFAITGTDARFLPLRKLLLADGHEITDPASADMVISPPWDPSARYARREEYQIAIARLTAEGAIALLRPETGLSGAHILLLGYGRIARLLARELQKAGALVTAAARSGEQRAWAEAEGIEALPLDALSGALDRFDVIIGTIPAPVLPRKMLEKLELLEVDEEDTSALRLKFPPSPRSGSYPVIMEGVGKSYGDHVVFRNANLTIERGDKVAFVGKNGEGKSTLVKCIMNEIDHEGTLTLGHNVQIGYFAQNQASLLDENLTVFQTIDDVAKGEIRNKIRDLLGAFMFGGPEESMKKVKVLSGGERTRLAMIKLLLEPVNLLILDEPTNHLDMKTKDILKQALMDFDGTLIVVSHDRDFLDGLVTKVYEFGNQRVKEHLCGIYEFLETKKMESLRELERKGGKA